MVLLILLALPMVFISGCTSSKSTTTATNTPTVVKPPSDGVENIRPCYGIEYQTNKEYLRANGIGESMDEQMADNYASANAREELAKTINVLVKAVTESFAKSAKVNNKEEMERRLQDINVQVTKQNLAGSHPICQKQITTKDGKYKSYMTFQLSGNEVLSSLSNRISKDQMLKVDYDAEKFKKFYEEEMNKLDASGN